MLMREEIKENGASGIIVTHSHAAAATADRVLLLTKDGLHPAGGTDAIDNETARNGMTPTSGGARCAAGCYQANGGLIGLQIAVAVIAIALGVALGFADTSDQHGGFQRIFRGRQKPFRPIRSASARSAGHVRRIALSASGTA